MSLVCGFLTFKNERAWDMSGPMPTQLETTWTGCQSGCELCCAEHYPVPIYHHHHYCHCHCHHYRYCHCHCHCHRHRLVLSKWSWSLYVREYNSIHSVFLFSSSVRFITNWVFLFLNRNRSGNVKKRHESIFAVFQSYLTAQETKWCTVCQTVDAVVQ